MSKNKKRSGKKCINRRKMKNNNNGEWANEYIEKEGPEMEWRRRKRK